MKECDALTAGGSKDEVQMAEKPACWLPEAPKLLTGLVKQQPLRRLGLGVSIAALTLFLCLEICSTFWLLIQHLWGLIYFCNWGLGVGKD